MPRAGKPKPRFTQYDSRVMAMIAGRGPILALTMRHELDIPYSTIDCVLKRLRAGGAIEYVQNAGWRLKPPAASKDPLSFMEPVVQYSGYGWFGPAGKQY